MKFLRILVIIIRNKYIVITTAFFIWILIFDKNNLLSQLELSRKLHKLKDDKKFYIGEIKKDEKTANKLLTDPDYLEKFAREKYLMKRDSEDIFLVIPADSLIKK